ncbi:hypothetical protein C8F01DRAFT_1243879 [Mycena amicta]|nr:hypothetical protein C8F01DRAFT_1243879 [Mycena amicta]
MANSHIELTIGALLAGGMLAVALSAILGFQTFLYFAFFKNDQSRYKLFVVWIWLADTVQTAMICTAMWQYNVVNFLHMDATARIVPALAVNIAMTATITFSANVFYTWRIHRLSDKNWWFTGPIVGGRTALRQITLLSSDFTLGHSYLWAIHLFIPPAHLTPLFSGSGMGFAVAIDMILSQTFSKFTREHGHIILLSTQAVSSFTEIVISLARYYYLRRIRRGATIPHEAVDTIVIFTVNDGCLQSAVILVVMICFLAIPNSFVFLAVQFAVAKIASNSMLAT